MIGRAVHGLLAGLSLLMPTLGAADVVVDCGELAGAETIIEPWEEHTRTFSHGSVRVAVVDLGEPECCRQHLIVLYAANMYGGRGCALVARNALVPNGWHKVGLGEAIASRDDVPGLRISVPVYSYDPATGGADPATRREVAIRVRQAAGAVSLDSAD